MPFLLAEILNFQGSTHLIGVGSLSSVIDNEQYVLQARDEKVRELCISYLSNMMSLGFSKEEATNFLTEYSSKLKEPNKCNH